MAVVYLKEVRGQAMSTVGEAASSAAAYTYINKYVYNALLIPVAARSKAWVYGRSLAGIVGSNPA